MLPTTNILARTFHIRTARGRGTAFTVDFMGRRYLVTAQHLVGTTQLDSVGVETDRGWEDLPVKVIAHSPPEIDVSVLSPSRRMHDHCHLIELFPDVEVKLMQKVHLSGIAEIPSSSSDLNDIPYRMPLVKGGIVSGYDEDRCFLAGTTDPGMAGGVVFMMDNAVPDIIGVITRLYLESGNGGRTERPNVPYVGTIAGIFAISPFWWVPGLISRNPKGFKL